MTADRKGARIGSTAAIVLAACLALNPAFGSESPKNKKKEKEVKQKVEAGASCKAPVIGPCGSCSVTCSPGEAARCVTGQAAGNLCHIQPSCRCGV
jgi:mevalonate kinase